MSEHNRRDSTNAYRHGITATRGSGHSDTADHGACARIAGERADHSTRAGAKQAAGHCAIARRRAASRQSKHPDCSK
jgi:hypothetical protein